MSFFEFIKNNLSHVLPILIAGGLGLAIIVERARALFVTYPVQDTKGFFNKISELVLSGKTSDAVTVCEGMLQKPLAHVVKAALIRAHLPESMIEHGLQVAVGEASQAIHRRTAFLSTIANVATLLGLFGTIAGLISSFEAVGHADAQQKSTLLAAGISTAMNATMMGLAVAIPCMIAYAFYINRANRLVAEMEHNAIRTLEIIKQSYYSVETPSSTAADATAKEETPAARKAS